MGHPTKDIKMSTHLVTGVVVPYSEVAVVVRRVRKEYNKLVRDLIPVILEEEGKSFTCEQLREEDYILKLDEKLNEELAEYQSSKSMEELADLLEVMEAVVKARGFSWSDLVAIQNSKRVERGGFEKRLLLKEVIETDP